MIKITQKYLTEFKNSEHTVRDIADKETEELVKHLNDQEHLDPI